MGGDHTSGDRYPNEAFKIGPRAYGLQFHLEVDACMAERWAAGDAQVIEDSGTDPSAFVSQAGSLEPVTRARAAGVAALFAAWVEEAQAA